MFNKAFKSIKHGIKDIMKSNSSSSSKFVINGHHYNDDKLIAEGGYGYVHAVSNSKGNKYALKKMNLISQTHVDAIKKEIAIWKTLNHIHNVIKIIDYEFTNESVFILMELCSEGSLLDYINKMNSPISENEALHIIKQICLALYDMHNMNPPVAHRDIKVENVLKFGNVYKLCDFGSASSECVNPVNETKQSMRDKFDKYERCTTFIYRPPEMIDEYANYVINTQVDVWAVGCILYTILFQCHPFQDAQKLTITSCHYYIPKEAENYSMKIIDFIRWMLTPNPIQRPSIKDVLVYIQRWNSVKEIPLCQEVLEIKRKQEKILNDKKRRGNNDEVSAEELEKARLAIIKDMQKKAKYNRKKENDDLDDLFDDGDEYYKANPEKREINERRMNVNCGEKGKSKSNNNNDPFGFNFGDNGSGKGNNNVSNSGNSSSGGNGNYNGPMLFDFNAAFSNQQSNQNVNMNNNNQQRQLYQIFQDNSNNNGNYNGQYFTQQQGFQFPQSQQTMPQQQQQQPQQNILDFFAPPSNSSNNKMNVQQQQQSQQTNFQFDKFFN